MCRGLLEGEDRDRECRKTAWLWAGVIAEHNGSITAVIRHQTKGTSRAGQRGRGGRGRMDLDTPALSQGLLMKCQPWSVGMEVSPSAVLEHGYRLSVLLQTQFHNSVTTVDKGYCNVCYTIVHCDEKRSSHT